MVLYFEAEIKQAEFLFALSFKHNFTLVQFHLKALLLKQQLSAVKSYQAAMLQPHTRIWEEK